MRTLLIACVSLALSACRLYGLTADEVIRLSRAGVSDDVILSQIEADGSAGTLSAAEAERLHHANVSHEVIRVLIGAEGESGAPEAVVPGPGEALVVFRNADRKPVSVSIDPGACWLEFTEGKGAKGGLALAPGDARQLALPAGVYSAVWRGQAKVYRVSVRPAERTDLILLTIDAPDAEGTRLQVLRNGREFGSTVLRLTAKAAPVVVERAPRTVILQPRETVIVQQPATVIVAPEPVYVPAPVYPGCATYVVPTPAPCGYVYPYTYGTYSPSLPDWHHGNTVYYGPTYWGGGCGR